MQAVANHKRGYNINFVRLTVDVVIFTAFLIAMSPHFSGIAIHEWLSMGLAGGIIVHLLINWSWVVNVTKRFLGKVTWSARVNYVLNLLLFIDMTLIIFTGLMISEAVLPTLGLEAVQGGSWRMLHSMSADLFPFIMGLHVALHWRWIVNTTKSLLGIGKRRRDVTTVLTNGVAGTHTPQEA